MIKMTGAQIIIHLMERQGISAVAGIPGGANLPLYDALSRSERIRHILARHEQGAGFIAQGWARVSGQPQVCFATSGPGATNILTAVADAKLDSIPVIFITGQVPLAMIGTDAFQEVDTFGMSLPLTKHNFLVRSAADLLTVVPSAFRIAASGRPGPVLIDVPKDIQNQVVEFDAWPEPGRPDSHPRFDSSAVAEAAKLINAARRPVLYLGGGVVHSGAGDLAVRLAEKGGLPTTMSLMGLGSMAVDHPLSLGMLGMHAARYTNFALDACDLLIAVGVRFDDRATGKVSEFCPGAGIIHIDIDPSELGKLKKAHVEIVGDVGEVLKELVQAVRQEPRQQWLSFIAALKERHPMHIPGAHDPRGPYGLILQVADLLDDEAIIATDVGQHQMRTAQVYLLRRPRQFLTSGGLGTMGFGLPAAIGAALAFPDRRVICFSGDGSLLMNIQELATAVEQNVNIKIILMDNSALGLVHQQQDLFYGKRIFASDYRARVDFVKIAEGFGMKACCLAETDDPTTMLRTCLNEKGPRLIHAPIDVREMVYPMVPPGSANNQMIDGDVHEPDRPGSAACSGASSKVLIA